MSEAYCDDFDYKAWRVCPVCQTHWNWGYRCRQAADPFNLCGDCREKEGINHFRSVVVSPDHKCRLKPSPFS